MFHDGVSILNDKSELNASGKLADPRRLRTSGRLAAGRDMAPGEYVLQFIVTDKLAKGKFTTAVQSVNFEIEE
jgi:hypothetical protein